MTITLNGTTGITTPAITNNGTLTQTGAATLSSTLQSASTIGVGGATPAASGAGITFPATQSASTDANTLDDYEEGTWTPALRFGSGNTGITYATRVGTYVKVGRMVTVRCYVNMSNKGSSTGQAYIDGLPFNCENQGWTPPSVWFYNGNIATVKTYVEQNASYIVFQKDLTSSVTQTDFNNTTEFMVFVSYFV